MGKSSPSAPSPPDPFQSAAAQWALNSNTFNAVTNANRYNVVTPYGNQTWTKTPAQIPATGSDGSARNAGGGSGGGSQDVNQDLSEDGAGNAANGSGGNSYYQQAMAAVNGDPTQYDWTETQALNPQDQQILDLQRQTNLGLGNAAVGELGQIQGMLAAPMNFNNAPSQVLNVQGGPMQTGVANAGPIATGINTSGVPGLVGGNALAAQQRNVNNALYQQATSRLDPQWANSQKDLEAQLANEGINQTANPDAWNRAMTQFDQARNDAYNQANYSAIGQGVSAANTLFNQGAQANSQLFGQAASQAGMQNTGQAQKYNQNLGNANLANSAQSQLFQQGMANAGLQNQGRQQSINETATLRNQPISELNSLVRGTPVQQGNFGPAYTGNMASPDIMGAIQNQYQGQLGAYNAQVAQNNAANGGLFSLGGAALAAFI